MKKYTLNKLIELGKKDRNIRCLIEAFLETENKFPDHDIEEEDINKFLILVLEMEKQTPEIKQAIKLLREDHKIKEDKEMEPVRLTLSVRLNGELYKIDKAFMPTDVSDLAINQICNEFKEKIKEIVNDNK